jgi:cytosine deaminase
VVDAGSEFEAVCERADVLASVRNGEYLFEKEPVKFKVQSDFMK